MSTNSLPDISAVRNSLERMIDQNQIDLVIFFRDPLNARSNEPDVNKAIRLCDIHNVPLATNIASAEMLLKSLEQRRS